MDHMMRLVKAWLMIGLFLSFLIYAALLIQSRPLEPLTGTAPRVTFTPPTPDAVPSGTATSNPQPMTDAQPQSPEPVELTQFPGDESNTQPNVTTSNNSDSEPDPLPEPAPVPTPTNAEPNTDALANAEPEPATSEPPAATTSIETNPSSDQQAADEAGFSPEADLSDTDAGSEQTDQPEAGTIGGGPLLNIEVPDLEARLTQAEIDNYQRVTLRLPAGAVVSAPFAGEVVKTYLAPQTGYTLYLVSKEKQRVLMIGGLRKDQLAAAGTSLPGGARLGLTAVTDASEHLLYLQVRKLDDASNWWNGSLEDPRPYCRAWLKR